MLAVIDTRIRVPIGIAAIARDAGDCPLPDDGVVMPGRTASSDGMPLARSRIIAGLVTTTSPTLPPQFDCETWPRTSRCLPTYCCRLKICGAGMQATNALSGDSLKYRRAGCRRPLGGSTRV